MRNEIKDLRESLEVINSRQHEVNLNYLGNLALNDLRNNYNNYDAPMQFYPNSNSNRSGAPRDTAEKEN